MITPDPEIVESYRAAFERRGSTVRIERVIGYAPNATTKSVTVPAIVEGQTAGRTQSEGGEAAPIEDGHQVMVMSQDLEAAGFPLPVRKHDKIILTESGDKKLDVVTADAERRALAGAIDIVASGVS